MLTFIPKFIVLSIALFLFISSEANAQNSEQSNVEQELSVLKQEVNELKKHLETIGSQVKDIHDIATASQRPQHRKISTQENFAGDGEFANLGDDTAEIAIVEFSDYQCPYCKHYVDTTFGQLKANFIDKGKVRYVTRDFPLGFHKQAKGAAIAANCSLQQGAYWPMREQLFNNMQQLGDDLYQSTAEQLKLDMDRFTRCLEDEAVLAKVEQDINYGASLGIQGTPSFLIGKVEDGHLINPTLLVGAQSYETFATVLNEVAAEPAQEASE